MINLLSKREQKKIILLYQVYYPHYEPVETFTTNYISVLLNELNKDFQDIHLPISIIGSRENVKLHNPKALEENYIFMKLFNYYSLDSPSIMLIDQLIHYTYADTEFNTDVLADELYMTRQNIYKLLEKINVSLAPVNLKILTKNSIIELEGNPINAVGQIYRYFTLHFRHVYPDMTFDVLRLKMIHRIKSYNIDFIDSESLTILTDCYATKLLPITAPTNKIEYFFKLLELVGKQSTLKEQILQNLLSKEYDMVHFSNDIMLFFQKHFNFDEDNHPNAYIYDILILTIFSHNMVYRDFESFITFEEKETTKNMTTYCEAFNIIQQNKYEDYCSKSFIGLIDLFLPIYNKDTCKRKIKIFVSISRSPAFNSVIKHQIKTFINNQLFEFCHSSEDADLIISDIRDHDNNKILYISDLNTQLSSPAFYSQIITKLKDINSSDWVLTK